MNLKDILIKRMRDLGIDQEEVARRSGVSQAAISKMVVGKTKNTKFPAKIARAIEVEPGIFMAATEGKLTEEDLKVGSTKNNYKTKIADNSKHTINDSCKLHSSDNIDIAVKFLKNPPKEMKDVADQFAAALCILAKK